MRPPFPSRRPAPLLAKRRPLGRAALIPFACAVVFGAHAEAEATALAPDRPLDHGAYELPVEGSESLLGMEPAGSAPSPTQLPETRPEPDPADAALLPAGTGTRWLRLLGSTLLLGAAGFYFGVLPVVGRKGAVPELRTRIRDGLRKFGWAGIVLLGAALPLQLVNRFRELDPGAGWSEASGLLFQTAWGAGWFLHLLVLALALVGLVLTAPRGLGDRGWRIFGGAMVLLPLTHALQGHAWGADGRPLAVASIYLHMGAAGLWLGGLILLILVGLPAVRATPRGPDEVGDTPSGLPPLARLVNAFSRLAIVSVALLALTGLLNAWLIVGSLQGLVATQYGRTLLIKLGAVAVAFLLGFHNWRRVRPSLAKHPDAGALRIPASVEAALGIFILLAVSALVGMPHP